MTQAAALLYLTDYPMFEPAMFPLDRDWGAMLSGDGIYGSSLDHAVCSDLTRSPAQARARPAAG